MVIQTDPITSLVSKPGTLLDEVADVSHPLQTSLI